MTQPTKFNVELTGAYGMKMLGRYIFGGNIGDKYEKHHTYGNGVGIDFQCKHVQSYRVENDEIIIETAGTIWHLTSFQDCTNITCEMTRNEILKILAENKQ